MLSAHVLALFNKLSARKKEEGFRGKEDGVSKAATLKEKMHGFK